MEILAKSKGLTLTCEIAADVPETLQSNAARLTQILNNLVENAVKFTDEGGVEVCVIRPDERRWAIQVRDSGVGIPPAAQQYIFEAFRQVDASPTREYFGVGLGLSIVKQLATLLGGDVALESEVGKGSTFTVYLPITPVMEEAV